MISSEEHDKNVGERMKLEAERATDAASGKKYRAGADTECQSGEGKKCRSARASRDFYDNSVKGLDARIQLLAPAKPVSVEAEQLGTLAAALGYDKERVKAIAVLLTPFLTTLFLEFGTIVSFGFAFSARRYGALRPRGFPLSYVRQPDLCLPGRTCSGPRSARGTEATHAARGLALVR